MAELSDEDLARFEEEFNRLRSEVYVFRAIIGAIMANAVASREGADEFFEAHGDVAPLVEICAFRPCWS